MSKEQCARCGHETEAWLEWRTFNNGTRHISVNCTECGRWLKWAPQTEGAVRAARPEGTAARAAQPDLLR